MPQPILFAVLDLYSDWEAAYVSSLINYLGQGKYEVKTISVSKEPIRSLGGFTLLPDYDIASIPPDFAGVILVGGMSWRTDAASLLTPLVRQALSCDKVLGAICDASTFLSKAGALNNVHHTGNLLSILQEWGGEFYTGSDKYENKQAVRDGKIVTANGTAALEFAKEILIALNIASESTIQAWYDFYKLGAYQAPMPPI